MKEWVSFRVETQLKRQLKEIARRRGIQLSDLLRQLILKSLADSGYLDNETKKALEV